MVYLYLLDSEFFKYVFVEFFWEFFFVGLVVFIIVGIVILWIILRRFEFEKFNKKKFVKLKD